MGYMRHHAIVGTGWERSRVTAARAKAIELGCQATEIIASATNMYVSFMIPPDGSKEGWDNSDAGDAHRDAWVQWTETTRSEDGALYFDWAEVSYGDDDGVACLRRAGDPKWTAMPSPTPTPDYEPELT